MEAVANFRAAVLVREQRDEGTLAGSCHTHNGDDNITRPNTEILAYGRKSIRWRLLNTRLPETDRFLVRRALSLVGGGGLGGPRNVRTHDRKGLGWILCRVQKLSMISWRSLRQDISNLAKLRTEHALI